MNSNFRKAAFTRRHVPVAVFMAMAAAQGAAAGTDDYWYVAAAGSGSDLDQPKQTIANAPIPGSTLHVTNAVDFGWGGLVAVGRTFGGIHLEAEAGYTENKSDSYTVTSPISIKLPQNGKNNATRYMADVSYNWNASRIPLTLSAGFGMGAADVRVTTFAAPAKAPNAPPSQLLDYKQTVFAYQLFAGLSHQLSEHLAINAQYRWFDAGTIVGVDSRGQRATRDIAGNNVDLGLRYRF